MQVSFSDGDIVSYIFKYNQIFKTKTYRLTNIPYSINNNKIHIIQVLDTLFETMPFTTIMMTNIECEKYHLEKYKKLFLPGYENYYYEYDNLVNNILLHKNESRQYKRFIEHAKLEVFTSVTSDVEARVFGIFDQWYAHHPNPSVTSKKRVKEKLSLNPYIFIVTYDGVDIGCYIGSISDTNEKYLYICNIFDLSRCGYHNCTLLSHTLIMKYIKENLHIIQYYVGGYSPDNTNLKHYKEQWCAGKILIYGITQDYLIQIKDIVLNNNIDELILM